VELTSVRTNGRVAQSLQRLNCGMEVSCSIPLRDRSSAPSHSERLWRSLRAIRVFRGLEKRPGREAIQVRNMWVCISTVREPSDVAVSAAQTYV